MIYFENKSANGMNLNRTLKILKEEFNFEVLSSENGKVHLRFYHIHLLITKEVSDLFYDDNGKRYKDDSYQIKFYIPSYELKSGDKISYNNIEYFFKSGIEYSINLFNDYERLKEDINEILNDEYIDEFYIKSAREYKLKEILF